MSMGSWLKTHKKKIITHTAIVAGYMLLLIFLIAPLFDRLEALPGEAQLYRFQLPAETTDMRYTIEDIRTDGRTGVEISGWAFVDGQDCRRRELYIVLKSEVQTYIFDTRFDWKPGLIDIGTAIVPNADQSGFKTLIPARKIRDGEYVVGFYVRHHLRDQVLEALYYADRVVVKSQDSVNWAFRASKAVEVSLPQESGNIAFSITEVRRPADLRQRFVEIRGWAFIEGQSAKDRRTYVVLKSHTNTYVFDTIPYFAWGVANPYSAFIARIPMDQLAKGRYRIGIYIADSDAEAFRYTDSFVTMS